MAVRVLATRPKQQNQAWAHTLAQKGYEVVECPLLEIRPLGAHEQRSVINVVLELDTFQKAIFVSQNAVAYGFDFIYEYWPQFPLKLDCYAVGKKTAQLMHERLEECMCFSYLTPEVDVMTSEQLLALPAFQDVENQAIVVFRGLGGREAIRDELTARGAKVSYCELYLRACPDDASPTLQSTKLRDSDVIPVFSGDTLQNLDELLSVGVAGAAEPLLILPSERVAALAEELGYERFAVAKNASEAEMLKTLDAQFPRRLQ